MLIWMCRSYLFKVAAVSCQKLLQAAPEPDTGIFQPRGRDIPLPGLNSGNETGLGVVGGPFGHCLEVCKKKIE